MKKRLLLLSFLISGLSFHAFTQEDCAPPTAFEQLDINNVRANYYNNGQYWNNEELGSPGYEIPMNSGQHSIFFGGLWIGGINELNDVRLCINGFGSSLNNNSILPGPMNNLGTEEWVTVSCADYDHIYKVYKSDVVLHRLYFEMFEENDLAPPTTPPFENGYDIPDNILNWPAHAEIIPDEPQELAPYFDNDCCGGTPGIYEPELGDYPAFRFPDNEDDFDCEKHLLGDQVLWWVNHNGNSQYDNSDLLPTGFEIHNMAYSFISDDQMNNTTFLRQSIINRSGWNYEEVHIGQFVDVDLGGSQNDYIGTDVDRGMVYYYNGDIYDEDFLGANGYEANPPAIGFDWVGGPLADENNSLDDNYNGIIDDDGERKRLDFANTIFPTTNFTSQELYNLLSGLQMNGTPHFYGYGVDSIEIYYKMVYPGDSDPFALNTYGIPVDPWSEITSGNPPGDRRNLMSSGPFTFAPDEKKVFTLATPWAREEGCDAVPCSVDLLKEANDLAQELHDNCYEMPCMVLDVQFEVDLNDGYAFFSSVITSGESYHWTFGDGSDTTTTVPFASHTYANIEDVVVCLAIDYGCGTNIMCDTLINLTTSLDEPDQSTTIELFPNPAINQLHIQLSGFDQQPQEVLIFSLSGQLVKQETLSSNSQNIIDISSLNSGMYILKVGSSNGNFIEHKRFVVVK